jgi:hypothetical protein
MTSRVLNQGDQEMADAVTAADLMTEPAVTAAPDDTVEHAARQMYTHRVKRLPVTDSSGRLVGIISRADVLSVFDRPDGEIRGEIAHQGRCPDEERGPRLITGSAGGLPIRAGGPGQSTGKLVARTSKGSGPRGGRSRTACA